MKDLLVTVEGGAQYILLTRMVDGKILVPLAVMVDGPHINKKGEFVVRDVTMDEMPSVGKRMDLSTEGMRGFFTAYVKEIREI